MARTKNTTSTKSSARKTTNRSECGRDGGKCTKNLLVQVQQKVVTN